MTKKKWVREAVPKSHEGRLREKAEAAGESTRTFAQKHKGDSGKTGAQSRLAITLIGMNRKKGDVMRAIHKKGRD